jgi:sortase A
MNSSSSNVAMPRSTNSFLRWCSRLCLLIGLAAIVWSIYIWVDARIYQIVQRRQFDAIKLSNDPAPPPVVRKGALTAPRLATGSVLGQMEIPRVGISVMVLEGDSDSILRRAAGHLESTAIPGQPGNVAIAAHRDTFFRALRNVRDQDVITLITLTGTYRYQVDSVEVVGPNATEVLADSPQPTLTLITCYPFYYVGPAPNRFVVRARQMSSDSPAR